MTEQIKRIKFEPTITLSGVFSFIGFVLTIIIMAVKYGDRIESTEKAVSQQERRQDKTDDAITRLTDVAGQLNVSVAKLQGTLEEQRQNNRGRVNP